MKRLPHQEQRNNPQRRPPPSCGTPPPPLPPSSPSFPTSSDTGAGLVFRPRPTPWWEIAVRCRSRGLPLRPHGTWWRSPRAAAGRGEEPSDEMAAWFWSGARPSGERERGGGEGGGGVDPVGFACSVFRPFSWRPEFGLVFLRHYSPAIFLCRIAISTLPMTTFCAPALQLSSWHIQQRHVH
jgi:hypothetical protein